MTENNFREDRLLTIKEVAKLTGLAVGSLYHLVSEQRIPVVRISSRCIRFRLSSLERWFEELTEQPGDPTLTPAEVRSSEGGNRNGDFRSKFR